MDGMNTTRCNAIPLLLGIRGTNHIQWLKYWRHTTYISLPCPLSKHLLVESFWRIPRSRRNASTSSHKFRACDPIAYHLDTSRAFHIPSIFLFLALPYNPYKQWERSNTSSSPSFLIAQSTSFHITVSAVLAKESLCERQSRCCCCMRPYLREASLKWHWEKQKHGFSSQRWEEFIWLLVTVNQWLIYVGLCWYV